MSDRSLKLSKILVLLCTACYFVSYITRINYGAVLLEIVKTEGISKVAASMVVTGSFITYGTGQLISGWLGDRIKPERLIFAGLLVTGSMNTLVPIFAKPGLILIFWCINGMAQAFMWPPLVKIMSSYLDNEQYKKACVRVTWGSSAGTIAVYLFAPVCIMWRGWRSLFFICAGTAICFAFVWMKGITILKNKLDKHISQHANLQKQSLGTDGTLNKQTSTFEKGTVLLLAIIMLAIIMQGTLRDGITTWMPSYVSETYQLNSSVSILSGVLLPIFAMICLELTSILNRKFIRNELICAGVMFMAGCSSALLLAFMPSYSATLSVLLAALIAGCMHGVNVILVCMLPPYFKRNGNVSTVSGLLNSCTYVGSALSTYGIAWVAQSRGWMIVIWIWAAVALTGTVLCLSCAKRWKQFVLR